MQWGLSKCAAELFTSKNDKNWKRHIQSWKRAFKATSLGEIASGIIFYHSNYHHTQWRRQQGKGNKGPDVAS